MSTIKLPDFRKHAGLNELRRKMGADLVSYDPVISSSGISRKDLERQHNRDRVPRKWDFRLSRGSGTFVHLLPNPVEQPRLATPEVSSLQLPNLG